MLVMLDPTTGHAGFHAGSARIPTRDQRAVLAHSRSPTGSPHPPGARSAWEVPWVAVWGRGAPGDPPRGPPFHDALLRRPQMMHSLSPTSWLQPPHPRPPIPTLSPQHPHPLPVSVLFPPKGVPILSPPTQHLCVPPIASSRFCPPIPTSPSHVFSPWCPHPLVPPSPPQPHVSTPRPHIPYPCPPHPPPPSETSPLCFFSDL